MKISDLRVLFMVAYMKNAKWGVTKYIKLQEQIMKSTTEHVGKFKLYQMSNSEGF